MRIIVKLIVLSFCIYSVNNVYAQEFNHLSLKHSFKSASLTNILDELQELLQDDFESIGHERVGDILENHDLGGGVLNYNGFDWYKPMLNYNVYARRDVAPELFSDRWIVHDQFSISIDAATLLTNLKEGDIIEISDEALELFTGLSFTRNYEYYHFADSYLDGISADFSKLFLSFNLFNLKNITTIENENIFKRSDEFNFYIGGNANIPIHNALAIRASADFELSFKNSLSMQHISENFDSSYRITGKSQKNIESSVELSVQSDFFKLLKLTLLSFEMKYELEESNQIALSLKSQELQNEMENSDFQREFRQFMRGSQQLNFLKPYIISSEQRKLENFSSKLAFLLLGSKKSRSLEEIKIIKDGKIKEFFKSLSSSQVYIQSLASKLSSFLAKLLGLSSQVKNRASVTKNLVLEFEKHTPIKKDLDSNEEMSLTFKQEFQTRDTKLKSLKNKTLFYLKAITPKYIELSSLIENDSLSPPFKIESSMIIHKTGIDYFNNLDSIIVYEQIASVCKIKNFDPRNIKIYSRRPSSRSMIRNSSHRCFRSFYKTYEKYLDKLKNQKIDLNKFKSLIGRLYSKSSSFSELIPLFGVDNIFIHGQIRANTLDNPFIIYFKSGNFEGAGLIENYRNQ